MGANRGDFCAVARIAAGKSVDAFEISLLVLADDGLPARRGTGHPRSITRALKGFMRHRIDALGDPLQRTAGILLRNVLDDLPRLADRAQGQTGFIALNTRDD